MPYPESDPRSADLLALDEQIAAEPKLPPLGLPPDAKPMSVEAHLARRKRRPIALEGVVENGIIRPLDPSVNLPEHSRVIIVTTETT